MWNVTGHGCMQDLPGDLRKEPAVAGAMLVLAETHHMPKSAAVCESFIAKLGLESYQRIPNADLQLISQAACLRIITATKKPTAAAHTHEWPRGAPAYMQPPLRAPYEYAAVEENHDPISW